MKLPAGHILAGFVVVLMAGCSPARMDLGQSGKTLSFVPGVPSFDMEAVPGSDRGTARIFLSIPPSSMTFVKSRTGFQAAMEVAIRIYVPETYELVRDELLQDTIDVPTYERTHSAEPETFSTVVKIESGMWMFVVAVTDHATGRTETRSQRLLIPDPWMDRPTMERMVLEENLGNGSFRPYVPFFLTSKRPGMVAATRLHGLRSGEAATISMLLSRAKVDRKAALPPYFFSLLPMAVSTRRGLLSDPDTVMVQQGVVTTDTTGPVVAVSLDGVGEGLFVAAIAGTIHDPARNLDTTMVARRAFFMTSKTFPAPGTIQELVESMTYILYPPERKRLAAIHGEREARAVFDSLWLRFREDKNEASDLIRRYYTRVEDANRLYSDVKEGWKTDRGMLHIICGPPLNVTRSADRLMWSYNIPGYADEVQFVFQRIVVQDGDIALELFELVRSASYERIWNYMIERWRRGGGW